MCRFSHTALAISLGLIFASGQSFSLELESFEDVVETKLTEDRITEYSEETNFTLPADSEKTRVIRAVSDTDLQTYGPVVRFKNSGSVNYVGENTDRIILIYLLRAGRVEVGTPENKVDSFNLNGINNGGSVWGIYSFIQRYHIKNGEKIRDDNVLINAKNININIEGNSISEVHGIHLASSTSAILNGDNISINVSNKKESETAALFASSYANIELNGNLDITADSIIYARKDSTIFINKYKDSRVRLNGDVTFYKYDSDDNSNDDAFLTLNLTTPDSYWEGNVKRGWNKRIASTNPGIAPKNLRLFLDQGAVWSVENIQRNEDLCSRFEAIPLNYLTFGDGGGLVDLNVSKTIIENLSGNGTVNIHTDDGITSANQLVVLNNADSSLSVTAQEITSDHIVNPEAFGEVMINSVTDEQSEGIATSAYVKEGEIYGEIHAIRKEDGSVVTTVSDNPKIKAYKAANMLSMLSLRQEGEDLTKRLGTIRENPNAIGSWVRISGNEQEHNDSGMKFESTTVQVGADATINPNWTLGGAFVYTDGETKVNIGSGDHDSYGLAGYATYHNQSGTFVDLMAKANYIDNEFAYSNLTGSYHTYGFMASAELGKKIDLTSFWYMEPQTQISFGLVKGKSFRTSNDVLIDQDELTSLVGRVGLKSGISLPNNLGDLYARVSYANDFEGSADGVARHIRAKANLDTDLGGDWIEYGLGGHIRISENMYTYWDLEMTDGGKVDENYLWNVGLHMAF